MLHFLTNQDKHLNGLIEDIFYEMFYLSNDPGMACTVVDLDMDGARAPLEHPYT